MGKKITVMGAGGIGGSVAGRLALAGEDVTIIDHWAAHIDAIKEGGLKVSGAQGDDIVHPKALHVGEAWAVREIDILMLGVKSYDNEWSLALLKPYLNPGAVVISMQNGVNEDRLAQLLGYGRVIGAVVLLAGQTIEPGHVELISPEPTLQMGELHGRITPRLLEIQRIIGQAVNVPLTTNIWGGLWSKLIMNTMSNPICGSLNIRARDVRIVPEYRRASLKVAAEACRVGIALGVEIDPVSGIEVERFVQAEEGMGREELETEWGEVGRRMGDFWSSLTRDVHRRRKTEVDSFSGYIVEKGEEVGLPTPANKIVHDLVREIEAGCVEPGPHNLLRLMTLDD